MGSGGKLEQRAVHLCCGVGRAWRSVVTPEHQTNSLPGKHPCCRWLLTLFSLHAMGALGNHQVPLKLWLLLADSVTTLWPVGAEQHSVGKQQARTPFRGSRVAVPFYILCRLWCTVAKWMAVVSFAGMVCSVPPRAVVCTYIVSMLTIHIKAEVWKRNTILGQGALIPHHPLGRL